MRTRNLLVLLCVSIPSFMINLDANVVAVSLNSIARSLHVDFAAIEWVVSTYTLTFAAMLLPAGTLSDLVGRKRMLVAGLALFTVASALCGLAASDSMLNCARALQGAGASLQTSAALATLSHEFSGSERNRAFSFWGSVIGIAIMLGPLAGGVITAYLGWRWAFFVNLPIGAVMIALTLHVIEDSKDPDANQLDVAGVLTFSGFLALLTFALISGNSAGWSRKVIVSELIGALTLFGAFLAVEARQARPMVDLSFFRRPTYVGANIAGLGYAMAFLTMLTYLPLYFQNGLKHTPLAAGLLMLPMAFPLFAVPHVVARWLAPYWSGRRLLSIGLALVGIGLLWTAKEMRSFAYGPILTSMVIAACGAGILNGETTRVGMTVIPPERAGMASGISGTVKFSGIAIGFAALGAVLFTYVGASVATDLPTHSSLLNQQLTRLIAGGNLQSAQALADRAGGPSVVQSSYGRGYEAMLMTAGTLALIAAGLAWLLIDEKETAPLKGTRHVR
jgi:EmrB/QacA subfamily drug resistance transporter